MDRQVNPRRQRPCKTFFNVPFCVLPGLLATRHAIYSKIRILLGIEHTTLNAIMERDLASRSHAHVEDVNQLFDRRCII